MRSGTVRDHARARFVAWALCAVAIASSGCVVNETAPPPRSGVVVSGPPPEPVKEPTPAAQRGGAVWVPGYWHWSGMQYTWIPGHWENAQAGRTWQAPTYSLRGGSYVYEPGGWR